MAMNAEQCVDIIYLSFKSEVSEQNYHDVIKCLRKLKDLLTVDDLKPYYTKYNFPSTYDPFIVIERSRFCYMFGKHNNDLEDICKLILESG
jgi:hypothetical protein